MKLLIALALAFPLAAQQGITQKLLNEPDQPPPARAKIDIDHAPTIGDYSAPLTMVEFTDLGCPDYAKFRTEIFPKLRDEFILTGKVQFVSRNLPLSIHPNALQAAEAGQCAREQGQFWEMRNWMSSNPTQLDLNHVRKQAIAMGLNVEQFRHCLASAKYRSTIKAEVDDATKNLHITGTPAFVIGKTAAIMDGEVVIGALPYQAFEDKLNALLK